MNKRLLSQCAWLISGFACIALCFRPLSWLLCAVLAVFLVIRSRAMAETFSATAHTKTSRIFAAVLCFFLGWGFRGAWMNHHLVQMVVGRLPTGAVSSGLLITLCALAGVVVGYPFASAAVSFFCFAREKAETERCALRDENRLFALSALLAAAAMLIQIVGCFSRSIWFDEAFSMTAIRLEDMLGVLASDVHPPLYYYILKAGVSLLHAIAPGAPLIHLAKLVSVVPHICLLLLGATVIRRRFGAMTAALYLALLMGSPNFVSFGYEIRMYSWAMLFVVLAYLAADRVVREGGMASWCMFVAFSLLAAYTHYYACVAAALLYLYILCSFALHERRRIVHWLCAAAATVAGYCPWLFVFLRQAKSVSESYWIDSIGFDVMKHVEFILDTPCAWLMLFAAIAALCRRTADEKETAHKRFAILGMLSPVWIIAIGMIASALIRPVFISRYAVLGCRVFCWARPSCLAGGKTEPARREWLCC